MRNKIYYIFLIILLVHFNFCLKDYSNENEKILKKWGSSNGGSKMRSNPDLNSDVISIIPYNTQVTVLLIEKKEVEINGIKGHWIKIKWNNQEGWLFDGDLLNKSKKEMNNNFKSELLLKEIKVDNSLSNIKKEILNNSNSLNEHIEQFNIKIENNKNPIYIIFRFIKFTENDYMVTEGYDSFTWEENFLEKYNTFKKSRLQDNNFQYLGKYKVKVVDHYDIPSNSVNRNYELFLDYLYIKGSISFQILDSKTSYVNAKKIKIEKQDVSIIQYKSESIKYIASFEDLFFKLLTSIN